MELYNKLENKLGGMLDNDGIYLMNEIKKILIHYDHIIDVSNNNEYIEYKLSKIKNTVRDKIKENLFLNEEEIQPDIDWIDNYLHIKANTTFSHKSHYVFLYHNEENKFELLFSCLQQSNHKYYNLFGNYQTKAELKKFFKVAGIDDGDLFDKINEAKDSKLPNHYFCGMHILNSQRKYNIYEICNIVCTTDDFYKRIYVIDKT